MQFERTFLVVDCHEEVKTVLKIHYHIKFRLQLPSTYEQKVDKLVLNDVMSKIRIEKFFD